MATASAGITTAVRKRKAKISMRLRRGRAPVSSPATDILPLIDVGELHGIGAVALLQTRRPDLQDFDPDQYSQRPLADGIVDCFDGLPLWSRRNVRGRGHIPLRVE